MKIRRFYSHNMRTALRQVADTFGDQAAILSNRKVSGGVEVIAALDYDESLIPNSTDSSAETAAKVSTKAELLTDDGINDPDQSIKSAEQLSATTEASTARRKKTLTSSANQEASNCIKESSDSVPLAEPQTSLSRKETQFEWSMDPNLQAMKEELGLMRSMMAEQLKGIAWNQFNEKEPLKAMVVRRLSKLGLKSGIINLFLPHVDSEQDAECCWQKILALLTKAMPVADNQLLNDGGIFALIGPTGVGKTTTIAKLAARFVIKHGADSVAMISTDNYRITAQEQLSTFGRLLNVPTAKVSVRNTLEVLLKRFSNKKLILIDTAGVGINDVSMMKQLSEISASRRPIKKLLLMSATSQAAVLKQSLELFSGVSPDGLILTKLDEATCMGEILSVVLTAGLGVLFTTEGQKIPEDIRLAKSHHLVAKAVWLANKYARDTEEWSIAQAISA